VDKWQSIDDILDFAISEEQAAFEFYGRLAAQAAAPEMRATFRSFADEETKHKVRLQAIKLGGTLRPAEGRVVDLRIADYLVDVPASPNLDYRTALVLAMKKEKAAFKLYSDLAASTDDENVRATFRALAEEEARHKLHFELEYDDLLAEN
jgi:rubrerythrin